MNTTYIKQEAIAQTLGKLFEHTCKYSVNHTDRWDNPIEPNTDDLLEFRDMLCVLAECHRINQLSISDVNFAIQWIKNTGFKYGHISGNYSTGMYGVRLGQLQNIRSILLIPEFECMQVNQDILHLYDFDYTILEYSIHSTFMAVKLHHIENIQNDWMYCINWNELENIRR